MRELLKVYVFNRHKDAEEFLKEVNDDHYTIVNSKNYIGDYTIVLNNLDCDEVVVSGDVELKHIEFSTKDSTYFVVRELFKSLDNVTITEDRVEFYYDVNTDELFCLPDYTQPVDTDDGILLPAIYVSNNEEDINRLVTKLLSASSMISKSPNEIDDLSIYELRKLADELIYLSLRTTDVSTNYLYHNYLSFSPHLVKRMKNDLKVLSPKSELETVYVFRTEDEACKFASSIEDAPKEEVYLSALENVAGEHIYVVKLRDGYYLKDKPNINRRIDSLTDEIRDSSYCYVKATFSNGSISYDVKHVPFVLNSETMEIFSLSAEQPYLSVTTRNKFSIVGYFNSEKEAYKELDALNKNIVEPEDFNRVLPAYKYLNKYQIRSIIDYLISSSLKDRDISKLREVANKWDNAIALDDIETIESFI